MTSLCSRRRQVGTLHITRKTKMSDDKMYPVTEKFVSRICDLDKLRIAWFERKSSSMKRQRLGISLCDFLDLDHILNIEELSLCLTDIEGRQQFCCMRTVQIQRYVCQ